MLVSGQTWHFFSLPREVLQLIWEYSQCGPPPKYHVRRNDFPPFNAACFDDHDGWTAFVELKTVVNSIYRAVIKRGFRNSNLDCLRPMIDTCLRNIDRVIICQNRWFVVCLFFDEGGNFSEMQQNVMVDPITRVSQSSHSNATPSQVCS